MTATDRDYPGTLRAIIRDWLRAITGIRKGCWRDNVFAERVWRSVKYEDMHLYAYASVREPRADIGRYLAFYSDAKPHSVLGGRTPDQVYFGQPLIAAA